jgi:hypothetical protein
MAIKKSHETTPLVTVPYHPEQEQEGMEVNPEKPRYFQGKYQRRGRSR